MAEVMVRAKISESLWNEFARIARRRRRKPEAFARVVLREAIQRVADEELLAASERAAHRAGLHLRDDIEAMIRQYRREKAKKGADGRAKTPNARRS